MEIKSCPYCGETQCGTDYTHINLTNQFEGDGPVWFVNCPNCGARGAVGLSEYVAVAVWNDVCSAVSEARK